MALRGPRSRFTPESGGELDFLQYEILEAKAYNLQRLGRKAEEALRALEAFDAAGAAAGADERARLVDAAGHAVWCYVVQREVCGLRDAETVLRELRVPREVRLRMGVFPARKEGDAA